MDLYGIPTVYVRDAGLSSYLSGVARVQSDSVSSAGGSSNSDDDDRTLLSLSPYPSILAEFNYYMGPEDVTSPKCLGWKDVDGTTWTPRCLPLGGNSVWASAGRPVLLGIVDVGGGCRGPADSGRGNGR